ncbi:protein MAIN-LIKE 2-like [Vicia villosa]|uniref:protein MAIN-LIKE 2-like n=1 Tax=Vicia villosa TaxID=3911 RepID=UPI00273B92D2|nr:protein MAIN-LIKE 2-like [Vicia villosa]
MAQQLLTMGETHRGTRANLATFAVDRFRTRSHAYVEPDERIIPNLQACGFGHIIKVNNNTIDRKFILALQERWRPETHTFHLPIGECTITLEDVYMLLGLPIDGKAVNRSVQHANSMCERVLGRDLVVPTQGSRGQGISLVSLRDYYDELVLMDNFTEEHVWLMTKVYIMLMFGKLLFPESTGNTVNFFYLSKFDSISKIRKYSWGSAVLAMLYQSLCKNAVAEKCTFYGCAFLLQVWGWWRMPTLSPVGRNNYTFPYATRFCGPKLDYSKNPRGSVVLYRDLIDHLRAEDVLSLNFYMII